MEINISENNKGQRLDRFLRKYFKQDKNIKLSDIYSRIRKGNIKVNGSKKKQNYMLQEGDKLEFINKKGSLKSPLEFIGTKEEKRQNIDGKAIKDIIIYEDKNWIFFNKPSGIVVHPGNKHNDDITLQDYLLHYIYNILGEKKDKVFTPSLCFRLDRDTSGIIIAAKNYSALKYLNQLIRQREVEKKYIAIIKGNIEKEINITYPLFRGFNRKFGRAQSFVNFEKGLTAETIVKKIKSKYIKDIGYISLVELDIKTGRMHQIRAHLNYINYPIIGDIMYGENETNTLVYNNFGLSRQMLHSKMYAFFDKFQNKTLKKECYYPEEFNKLI